METQTKFDLEQHIKETTNVSSGMPLISDLVNRIAGKADISIIPYTLMPGSQFYTDVVLGMKDGLVLKSSEKMNAFCIRPYSPYHISDRLNGPNDFSDFLDCVYLISEKKKSVADMIKPFEKMEDYHLD